jgi:hypothetical protein
MAKKSKARSSARKARRAPARKAARTAAKPKRAAKKTARKAPAGRSRPDALTAAMSGTERRTIGHVALDVARAGAGRVKRMVYPAGFRWSKDMKAEVGTDYCMHAHVGFLAKGEIHIEYADGCIVECRAPQVVAIDPGHDGWVVGNEPVVLIEFDFERDTVQRLGMPDAHRH